jgi:hypothetical protein
MVLLPWHLAREEVAAGASFSFPVVQASDELCLCGLAGLGERGPAHRGNAERGGLRPAEHHRIPTRRGGGARSSFGPDRALIHRTTAAPAGRNCLAALDGPADAEHGMTGPYTQ